MSKYLKINKDLSNIVRSYLYVSTDRIRKLCMFRIKHYFKGYLHSASGRKDIIICDFCIYCNKLSTYSRDSSFRICSKCVYSYKTENL